MKRVFSGARPTGKLHLGNYLGAIQNYVKLQSEYECVYCIVDWHALTTLTETSQLQESIYEMALDWLAAGIDPQKSIVFVQSPCSRSDRIASAFEYGDTFELAVARPDF